MSVYGGISTTDSSCILHLDAKNYTYTGLNGFWEDLSPQQNHCTSTNAPSASVNSDGRPALAFNYPEAHVHDYFQTQNNSGLSGTDFGITLFAVFEQSAHSTFAALLSQTQADGYNGMCLFSYGTNYDIATDHWNPGGRRGTTNAVQTLNTTYVGAWSIPNWQAHQSSSLLYVDGVDTISQVYSADNPALISLTANPFIVGNWQITRDDMDFHGFIEKIIVFNRAFDAHELSAFSRNLMVKYKPSAL